MNNYARLSHVKGDVAGVGTAANAALDPIYLRDIDSASRDFEGECGERRFYSMSGIRYFGENEVDLDDPAVLWLDTDLASVTTLAVDANADGVYELTLTADEDYWLAPYSAAAEGMPYRSIELNLNSSRLTAWPRGRSHLVKITGLWGYPEILDAAGTVASGLASDAAATTATMTAATVEAGDVIKIEDEQIYVGAATTTALSELVRGINGTTATTHANGTAVKLRRYRPDIEEVVRKRVVQGRWHNNSGMPDGEPGIRGFDVTYARWSACARRHSAVGV